MTEPAITDTSGTGSLPLEEAKGAPFTTAQVNQLLWNKYTDRGEYVLLFDVPNIVGHRQERRCDAVALGMWQQNGRLIHGFEIKVSRSDWLREVRDVGKADPFIEQCDRWWLVTGDLSVAKPEEIPEAWGWMNATKTGLRIQRPAKSLPQHETLMKRLWAFALIRRAADRNDPASSEFQAALEKQRAEIERRAEERIKSEIARSAPAFELLRAQVDEFEKASGMKLNDWRLGNVGKLARKLTAIGADGYLSFQSQLDIQIRELEDLLKRTREAREAVGSPALTGAHDDD